MKFHCTSFSWQNLDSSLHFLGRTFDAAPTDIRIHFMPRGFELKHFPMTENSPVTKTKYAVLGAGSPLEDMLFDDAFNEKGLMGTMQLFPGYASYWPMDSDKPNKLNPLQIIAFVLGQCETIDEIQPLIESVTLVNDDQHNLIAPVHFMFGDKNGKTLVVEPMDKTVRFYPQNVGVMTNAPTYEWHMTNLRNYLVQTNQSPAPRDLDGVHFEDFGSGQGFQGLPGDYSPASRFLRMAFVKNYLEKAQSEEESVARMFDAFSAVTVPPGAVKADFYHGDPNNVPFDFTLYTSVMCADSRTYYFMWWKSRKIEAFRMDNLINETEAKMFTPTHDPLITYIV